MKNGYLLIPVLLLSLPVTSLADELISDNLIVSGSLCAGADCVEGADFGSDTMVLKSPTPQLLFEDTSMSAGFPTEDWLMGITDGGSATPASFFIKNLTQNLDVLVISADGDVALGSGAEVVADAISVGDLGSERRITHVADGVDDTDAVTLAQFNAFKSTATASVSTDVEALDTRLSALEARLSDLVDRLETVASKVE